ASMVNSCRIFPGSWYAWVPVTGTSLPPIESFPFMEAVPATSFLSTSAPPWASIAFLTTSSALSWPAAGATTRADASNPTAHRFIARPPGNIEGGRPPGGRRHGHNTHDPPRPQRPAGPAARREQAAGSTGSEMESRAQQKQSAMPDGLADNLAPEQLADLIVYLQSLR